MRMEIFILLVVPQNKKVVSKYVVMECGVPYAVTNLMRQKHIYYAGN